MVKIIKALWFIVTLLVLTACNPSFRGDPGPSGTNGEKGEKGDNGPRGNLGDVGPQGDQGVQGAQGPQGQQGFAGLPGQAGASITVVQLCAGYVTTYPTVFPEQALCISDKLYGVYWNGTQAFLAELPPGDYASTSPQGCNLRVGPNCTVN